MSSRRICLRSLGSSAASGSSSSSTSGCRTSGAGERDALAFAAGELRGAARFLAGEADEFEGFAHAAVDIGGAVALEAELDVVARGEMREEGVVLEYGADVALVGLASVDDFAVEQDVAGGGFFESGDQAEGGRLAAAGGAEQGEETAARDGKRDSADRLLAGKMFDQLA